MIDPPDFVGDNDHGDSTPPLISRLLSLSHQAKKLLEEEEAKTKGKKKEAKKEAKKKGKGKKGEDDDDKK